MAWVVAARNTNTEQYADKAIDSQTGTADAVVGNKIETGTEKADTEGLEESEDNVDPFYLCTDPTCKGHTKILGDIIRWKLRHASEHEYSKGEIRKIVKDSVKQSVRDYQTVIGSVEEITDTRDLNTQVEETPSQQLGRCGCGEQQKPTQRSVGKTATEQQSITNTNRVMQSLKASVSAIPLVNVEVGGETTSGDETTNTEISTFNTIDTGTFPICPDLGCEEHLKMIGMIESWKRRNNSTREYSNEEVDERITNVITQEKNDGELVTEAVENVREEMLSSESDQKAGIEDSNTLVDPEERPAASEDTAASVITDSLYEQLDGIEAVDESDTLEHNTLDDKIAAIGTEFGRIEAGIEELEEDSDTQIKSDAKQQQLLTQLESMDTDDEEVAGQIDQLTENISSFDPQMPRADDQIDLFADQVTDLEENEDTDIDLSDEAAGSPEIQQLDSRLDAIDTEDESIMQRRDSLKQDVDLLDQRYERTTENIAELSPDQDTTTQQREESEGTNQREQRDDTDATIRSEKTTTSTPESANDSRPSGKETSEDTAENAESEIKEETKTVEAAQATADSSSPTEQSETDPTDPSDQTAETDTAENTSTTVTGEKPAASTTTAGDESESPAENDTIGDKTTENPSKTTESRVDPAQATGPSSDSVSSSPDTNSSPKESVEAGAEGDRILAEIQSQADESEPGGTTQQYNKQRKDDDSRSSV